MLVNQLSEMNDEKVFFSSSSLNIMANGIKHSNKIEVSALTNILKVNLESESKGCCTWASHSAESRVYSDCFFFPPLLTLVSLCYHRHGHSPEAGLTLCPWT